MTAHTLFQFQARRVKAATLVATLTLRRAAVTESHMAHVPPVVHHVLRSPGRPLDGPTRARMEPRFGQDLSRVRVHTDARAAESAQAVGALAYTVGQHVVFGPGQYTPASGPGQRLIAHELAHTVQQQAASAQPAASDLRIGAPSGAAEREAEAASHATVDTPDISPAGLQLSPQFEPFDDRMRVADQAPAGQEPLESQGSTLPFREATELNECVRIMGEPNAEYCRETVLSGSMHSSHLEAVKGGTPAAGCPVAALTPLTDADAIAMENGATVVWNNTAAGLQAAANSLVTLIRAEPGGQADISSAYRPQAYQSHLREVWDKARALRSNNSAACATIKAAVTAEMAHHALDVGRPVARISNHTGGRAVDITWRLPNAKDEEARIDELAASAGLVHRLHAGDRPHFELP